MASLLLVEHDDRVAAPLVAVLTRYGYEAVRARNGREALDALDADTDVVLLELGLPDMNGYEVCGRIRRRSDVPVIMVTAWSQLRSRIRGLESGADDYVVKPYDHRELVARIEAVRRRGRCRVGEVREGDAHVRLGDVCIDLAARRVTVGDAPVALAKKEFDVLALLARHRGATVPRERILREVWETDWKGLGRSLEVHVASVRRKLGRREIIETVRGVGYRVDGGG